MGFEGSEQGDTFNLTLDNDGWAEIKANEGADVFNIHLDGILRLNYHFGADMAPTVGLMADLSTGTINNDGFGFTDDLNILSNSGLLEIRP